MLWVSAVGTRARAEALTRYVNATVQKKPTVSLPSAREVLRTKIGDCNEHTALFVAHVASGSAFPRASPSAWRSCAARSTTTRGRRCTSTKATSRGFWLPVDPTFNQFPADATHFRLARGGLDKQAAILPLIGRVKITVLDLEVAAGQHSRSSSDSAEQRWPVRPTRTSSRHGAASRLVPAVLPGWPPMIAIQNLRKQYGAFTAVDGVDLDVQPGRDSRLPRTERRRQDDDDPDDCRVC